MRSNLVALMATLAFAGPCCAIAATPAVSGTAGTSSPATSTSSGGFVSSGGSNGSARSSGGSGGGGGSGRNGAGAGSGTRGFVPSGGFSRGELSRGELSRGEFTSAHGSMSSGGQQLTAMSSLAHGAAVAVQSRAVAGTPRMHRPHRFHAVRAEYNFEPDVRWSYCSASLPPIERTLYCDRIQKTKVGER